MLETQDVSSATLLRRLVRNRASTSRMELRLGRDRAYHCRRSAVMVEGIFITCSKTEGQTSESQVCPPLFFTSYNRVIHR
jgi:hypothetical protein